MPTAMHLLSAVAIVLLAVAALVDIRDRRIPNRIAIALAIVALVRLGYESFAGSAEATPFSDVLVALVVFALGAAFFHFRMLGGGDVKLLAAGALWAGSYAIWPFLFLTALAGGILAVLVVFLTPLWRSITGSTVRGNLPYGVAIATGGILVTAFSF